MTKNFKPVMVTHTYYPSTEYSGHKDRWNGRSRPVLTKYKFEASLRHTWPSHKEKKLKERKGRKRNEGRREGKE